MCSLQIIANAEPKMTPVATMLPKIDSLFRQNRYATSSPATSGTDAMMPIQSQFNPVGVSTLTLSVKGSSPGFVEPWSNERPGGGERSLHLAPQIR